MIICYGIFILSRNKRSCFHNFYTFKGSNNDTDYLDEPDYEYVDNYDIARTGKQNHILIVQKGHARLFQTCNYLLKFIRCIRFN